MDNNLEKQRLSRQWAKEENWYKWGPYLSERQWGTVREDYTAEGEAWDAFPYEHARMRVYRWGEDGLGGISDETQTLCFALSLWNGQDPYLKERMFGISNEQGNHGEDVKELYYYLDNTPTHSYMRMLYKYPQTAFPYDQLVDENAKRDQSEREFELLDTGIFNDSAYFDVEVEYAKKDTDDILIRLTIHNRADKEATLYLLPTLWFRNRWSFHPETQKPAIEKVDASHLRAVHESLGTYTLTFHPTDTILVTENETNQERVFGNQNESPFVKDAFHDAITTGQTSPFDEQPTGTKCAPVYKLTLDAGQSTTVCLRLSQQSDASLDDEFDAIFAERKKEADEFYAPLTEGNTPDDAQIKRQAWAGLLWSKQYYHYNVRRWLEGDPGHPIPPAERWNGRNADWQHLNAEHIMIMPDKWEYPWFAAWDQAFQSIAVEDIDLEFAKHQLYLHADPQYQAPDGRLPAYEWDFSAANPPLRAAISWLFYRRERELTDKKDYDFLITMFDRLRPNYEWWTNQVSGKEDGLFQGGFLGLDNISLFDRNEEIPGGGTLDQADATAWMATYTLYMMRIAVELAQKDPDVYEPLSCYYFDHYIRISNALQRVATLWIDDDDEESNNGFTYDVLHMPDGEKIPIPLRSLVGLANLFAVMTLDHETASALPSFYQKVQDYLKNPPSENPCYCVINEDPEKDCILFGLLSANQLERLSGFLFSEAELLAPGGIRSLSKVYEEPFTMEIAGEENEIHYTPGESDTKMFGGNSNWRGPVWYPLNFFIVGALQEFGNYYGDRVQVALPSGSDNKGTLNDAAAFLSKRLWHAFRPNEKGERPCHGTDTIYATDPHFKDLILFYEHFDGDTSRGLGASHQTGWTALVTRL
ncbi:MGH1-like glycoside hydrolase domain-containing protein [Spirosoma oryzicola]|uniref:MGH1-like glycoside hydrolase domain-containing protein n=1 Tax=Spirosoma oryzicola TaxID=2898794 RepID=UPI001E501F34|nr:glucosidase [Spirosoma oryzicola]UHG94059.1 glucosidase [Spirosoma oryzicola]